jgi:MarR family transcriptional regulator, transcriptional regulator for hemolysin
MGRFEHPETNRLEFGRRLGRMALRWRRGIDSRMRQFGLTNATWRPLLWLGRNGGGVRQTDLAAGLEIECASLVRLLDALEKDGLIKRGGDPADRRTKTVCMTEDGQRMYQKVIGEYMRASQDMLHDVKPEDLAACLRVFAQLEAVTESEAGSSDDQ